MKKTLVVFALFISSFGSSGQKSSHYNLVFDRLPIRWDEALPLGNGMLGALV